MKKISEIMMNSANDVELKDVKPHQVQIKNLTKEWNYFESERYEDH